jgi:hypothetical protein
VRGASSSVRSIRELFAGRRFIFPSYQRDYAWSDETVRQLATDLIEVFDTRAANLPLREPEYFLGLVVTIKEDNSGEAAGPILESVVDGQQRLTTLALLLCVIGKTSGPELQAEIQKLLTGSGGPVIGVGGFREAITAFEPRIIPPRAGRRNNNLSYQDRIKQVLALLSEELDQAFDLDQELCAEFGVWLLDHVSVVELVDNDPFDDQLLFDRINTRGSPLAPGDQFRSRMLAHGANRSAERQWAIAREEAAKAYDRNPSIAALDSERKLMSAWLAARYATNENDPAKAIRAMARDPYDWAFKHSAEISDARFFESLRADFLTVAKEIGHVLAATREFDPSLPGFYSAQLAKVPLLDALAVAIHKPGRKPAWKGDLAVASAFLDALSSRILLSDWRKTKGELEGMMTDAVVQAAKHSGPFLRTALQALLVRAPAFEPQRLPALTAKTKPAIRYANIRISGLISDSLGLGEKSSDLFVKGASTTPDIEHIMGDNYTEFERDYHRRDWDRHRQRFGAVTLLSKSHNRSARDRAFPSKIADIYPHSYAITMSISARCYDNQLRLKGKPASKALGLRPLQGTQPRDFDERETILCRLAERLWPLQLR